MDASLLYIQPNAPEPIYRQIVAQVRRLVASGQLCAHDALPSVRDVAASHAINPMTVSKAYSLLEAEGVLERLRGKGMVVAASAAAPQAKAQRWDLLEPALAALARQARELELAPAQVADRLIQRMESPSE